MALDKDAAPSRPEHGAEAPETRAANGGFLERNCSVSRTVGILSDAWTFLILREAFFGARRFEAFRSSLGLPRATLTDRLRRLTARDIFRQVSPSGTSPRLEYQLTKAGFDLYPCFIALMQFGDRWLSAGKRPPLKLIHASCGCETRPIVACSACLQEVQAKQVTYRDGPGAGRSLVRLERSARRSSDDAMFLKGRPSSVSRALQVIGDRWSFLVIREAFFGTRRYDRMQENLNIAPNILTDRLTRFVEKGILAKRLYQSSPKRHEYVLTEMGLDLYGPFIVMMSWGDRWLSEGRPPLILTHRACGRDFDPLVVCDRCREPIHAGVMRYELSYDPQAYGVPGPRDVGRPAEELG